LLSFRNLESSVHGPCHVASSCGLFRPPMKLLPRHCPDWRVQGASSTRAAIGRRSSEPSSGSSAIRVQVIISPCRTRKRADPLSPPRRLIRVSDRRSKRPAWKSSFSNALRKLGHALDQAACRSCDAHADLRWERPCQREVLSSRPAFAGVPACLPCQAPGRRRAPCKKRIMWPHDCSALALS
jgi:hypothetical protein